MDLDDDSVWQESGPSVRRQLTVKERKARQDEEALRKVREARTRKEVEAAEADVRQREAALALRRQSLEKTEAEIEAAFREADQRLKDLEELAAYESAEPLPLPRPVEDQPFTLPGQTKATTKGRAAGVMLVAGSSPEYIAEIIGFDNPTQAKSAAMKALAASLDRADREAIKDLLGARLEALFRSTFKRSQDPRYPGRETATAQALKIIEQQMKLFGVAAPNQLIVGNATEEQIREFVASVAQQRISALPKEKDVIRGEVTG